MWVRGIASSPDKLGTSYLITPPPPQSYVFFGSCMAVCEDRSRQMMRVQIMLCFVYRCVSKVDRPESLCLDTSCGTVTIVVLVHARLSSARMLSSTMHCPQDSPPHNSKLVMVGRLRANMHQPALDTVKTCQAFKEIYCGALEL